MKTSQTYGEFFFYHIWYNSHYTNSV
jgi:hypothetical protein